MKQIVETEFETAICKHLTENDDIKLWLKFFEIWKEDFELSRNDRISKHETFLEIGACSHWLRPHQFRLTIAGGFAYPVGYGGNGGFGKGLPELDWSVIFFWNEKEKIWIETEKYFGKKRLVCRVALPTRTTKHKQAVVNIIWTSILDKSSNKKLKMFYAFRKSDKDWKYIASEEL